jgi:hypothetical protein
MDIQDLDFAIHARWMPASFSGGPPPSPRCGHVACTVASQAWDADFVVVHGGIDRTKAALDDIVVLHVQDGTWFRPESPPVNPAARAFHAAAAVGARLFVFGGHVFVPQQQRLHQFGDLWALDTETWQWEREGPEDPDLPRPPARDRACMIALDGDTLLLHGGADGTKRRLDDAWVYSIRG